MKKILVILMAALFVLPMTGVSTIEAQNPIDKQSEKVMKKQYKIKLKELKKEEVGNHMWHLLGWM